VETQEWATALCSRKKCTYMRKRACLNRMKLVRQVLIPGRRKRKYFILFYR
jgi:hypothetical protein